MEENQSQAARAALHPTIFVIFGITGDLAARKLIPALLSLYAKKMLPQRFAIIGFSRRPFSREEFRELIRTHMNVKPGQFKEEDIKHFLDHMSYEQGIFGDRAGYVRLSERITDIDRRWGQCSNKLFHLSVPPSLYEGILNNLAASGLTEPCADDTGWTRVLIEKPFGRDLDTAQSLDKLLAKLFKEKQIFRIDHYLAKESLQNIIAFRFSNSLFEPIWRREFIDKVHVKIFEQGDISGRGDSYDPIGALKDVGQNHVLMMLATVCMDKPKSFVAEAIRKERAAVLGKLKAASGKSLKECTIRGQYIGYTNEENVPKDSQTETYFRIKSLVNSKRWKGVPFYLESGKALSESKTEIDVYFKSDKKAPTSSADPARAEESQNILTFRIQPDEGIKIKFFVKTPGLEFNVEPKTLKFKYSEQATPGWVIMPNDYERLIHDAFVGDQTLFASTEEIMASWKFIEAVIKSWKNVPLTRYEKGAREVL
ncbi:MAG: glucose-6-phosphate 1-dehydrogenase [Candidatus Parcubacteria bacterium]|nr:glucose-6-phosphate 1-dehydrogenase [Candidatus Parcubacteria bacterium]